MAMSDRSESLAERTEEDADISLGSAQIAQKAARKVMDALPWPDRRHNLDDMRLAGQQTMLARLSPRNRNRWPEVAEHDERIPDLDRRREAVAGVAEHPGPAGGQAPSQGRGRR
jgi:hypothetical protein